MLRYKIIVYGAKFSLYINTEKLSRLDMLFFFHSIVSKMFKNEIVFRLSLVNKLNLIDPPIKF